MASTDTLSATFAALADPTRRAILGRLSRGPATVNELAEPFDISLPAISRHLKVLREAGLVERGREAQWRPCALNAGPLHEVAEWTAHFRKHWEGKLDRMEAYLRELQQQPAPTTTPRPGRASRKGHRRAKD